MADQYIKDRLEKHIHMIPKHMHDGVRNYVHHGIEPGGFLTSVLSNDLKGAVMGADSINRQALPQWVEFVVWAIPMAAQGSRENVGNWVTHFADIRAKGTEL